MKTIDTLVDAYRKHAIDLLRFDAGLRRKALTVLRRLEADLIRQLQASDMTGELTAFQRTRFTALLSQVHQTIVNSYDEVSRTVTGQLDPLVTLENQFVQKSFVSAMHTNLLTDALTGEQLATIARDTLVRGAPSAEWWERQSADLAQRFADQIRQGMAAGETNQDLIRRIRGRRENGFKDGIMQTSYRQTEALVRSSVQAVANETRSRFYRDNADVIQGYIYHATLDNRTTQQCAALDGYVWDLEGNPQPGQGQEVSLQQPPLHWNCRSTLLPWLKSFKDLGIEGVDEKLPPTTRSSMDGPQTPGDDTFEDWLRGKPAAFQDDLLGPGKAELFRKGKIDLIEMIDQSGRPLTLQQIEARI
jgi:SPP1 gp7 family putative phage head morphogenesis protein